MNPHAVEHSPILIAALETSGGEGSVALLRGETVLGERPLSADSRHGVELHPALEALLAAAGARAGDLGLVVVGLGPGSFTGMRVGVAAARALAFAVGAPMVGVLSTDAIAAASPAGAADVVVVRDSRRGRVSLAVYGPAAADGTRRRTVEPVRLPLEEAAALVPDGALLLGDAAADLAAAAPRATAGDAAAAVARASVLGRLGLAALRRDGPPDPATVAPLYLEEPSTTLRGGTAP